MAHSIGNAGWTAHRASYAFRRQGNRDLLLTHTSGAKATVYAAAGAFCVGLPGGRTLRAPTRRAGIALALRLAIPAYGAAA